MTPKSIPKNEFIFGVAPPGPPLGAQPTGTTLPNLVQPRYNPL